MTIAKDCDLTQIRSQLHAVKGTLSKGTTEDDATLLQWYVEHWNVYCACA